MFAEFTLEGLALEVSAQREHVHRRLGAATLGISRVLEHEGQVSRDRLAARVAPARTGWTRPSTQTGLSRSALEALATANTAVARRVLGVPRPAPVVRQYVLPLLVGFTSETLIVLATASSRSQDFTGAMLLLEAVVLGALFGTRMGLVASLAPLALFGSVIGSSVVVGGESCGTDGCGYRDSQLHIRCRSGRNRRRCGGAVTRSLLPALLDPVQWPLAVIGEPRYVRDWIRTPRGP